MISVINGLVVLNCGTFDSLRSKSLFIFLLNSGLQENGSQIISELTALTHYSHKKIKDFWTDGLVLC